MTEAIVSRCYVDNQTTRWYCGGELAMAMDLRIHRRTAWNSGASNGGAPRYTGSRPFWPTFLWTALAKWKRHPFTVGSGKTLRNADMAAVS